MEPKVQDMEDGILKILRRGPATPDEVAKEMSVAWATAQGRLMKLVADGTLVSVRKGKVNVYFLKFPASVSPRKYPWAKARDLGELSSELEAYFPGDITAAQMIERETASLKIGLDASVLVASVKRVGEKYHPDALGLSKKMTKEGHEGVCSALVLTEVPGALASSTSMPLEKIYETEASMLAGFRVNVRSFEQYADEAVDFMLEFRQLKRRFDIGSADFHHVATAAGERCEFFVTTDEKHLLREECKRALSSRIILCNPSEALGKV